MSAATMQMSRLSPTTIRKMDRLRKPRVLSTANSGVRSRIVCIMMVMMENSSATSTALMTERMRKFRSPIERICCCAFSRNEAVLVSLDELANARSIVSDISAARFGSAITA